MNSTISPKESLAVIHKAIGQTQQNLKDNSIHFLIWGWATLLASILHYLLLTVFEYQHPYIAWTLMPIAGVIAAVVGMRQGKKAQVRTHIDRIISYLWGGFGIYLIILLVSMPIIGFDKTYPLIMGLYGLGTFIMGGVIRFKPLIVGAILCWVITIVSFYLSFQQQLLCIAAAITVSYLIPGYLIKYNKK